MSEHPYKSRPMYVVLIGPSGRTRKGVAIGIAKDMLKKVPNVTLTPESSSGRQAMILAMKRALTHFKDSADGKLKFHCSVTTFSEELSVFLGQGDLAYLSNLTDWYDSKDDWEYETVGRGQDKLRGLCLNMLGGTAPDWIQSMIPPEAVGGGFTSRIIFIVEEAKRKLVPEHTLTEGEVEMEAKLSRDLARISRLTGTMSFSDVAKEKYVEWYVEQDGLLGAGSPAIPGRNFAGYCERRATHLRKLMILCSASRGDDLLIEEVDFDKALSYLTGAEEKMHKTFGGISKERVDGKDHTDAVKNYIRQVEITTRKLVMQKFCNSVSKQSLNGIELALMTQKLIRVQLTPDDDKTYEWIGE